MMMMQQNFWRVLRKKTRVYSKGEDDVPNLYSEPFDMRFWV